MKYRSQTVLFFLLLTSSPAYAQLKAVTEAAAFSPRAVSVSFPFLGVGAEAGEIFDEWGVHFEGTEGGVPRLREASFLQRIHILPPQITVLRNEPTTGTSANRPLIVNFRLPVGRVGFHLVDGDTKEGANLKVTLRAFDSVGNTLGILEQSVQSASDAFFLGMETAAPQGISKLTISYSTEYPEEILSFILDFLTRPVFTTYVPHIADGKLASGALRTSITIMNLVSSTAKAELRIFDGKGAPMSLALDARGATTRLETPIGPFGTVTLNTHGTSTPAVTGYARIDSNTPIEAVAIFQVVDSSGTLLSEAAVPAERGKILSVGAIQKITASNFQIPFSIRAEFNSALAVVNTSQFPAFVRITLRNENSGFSDYQSFQLAPGEHMAKFITELFPSLTSREIKGSALVTSNQRVALAVLRTNGGLPVSGLPIGSTER